MDNKTINRENTAFQGFKQFYPYIKFACADCGQKLYNRRDIGGKAISQFGKEYNKDLQDYYNCSTHNTALRKFRTGCSAHRIQTHVLRELALEVIKSASKFVKEWVRRFA